MNKTEELWWEVGGMREVYTDDYVDSLIVALATVTAERDELKAYWFDDADPSETKYVDEYALAKLGAENAQEKKMSNALDHVRYECGIAGEEVARLVDALERQLADLQRERDELVGALKLADYIINGSDRIGGLLCCMDGYYAGVMDEELAQFDVVLAKVGAGKTGDV